MNIEKIKERLAGLVAKSAEGSGATEAEAMASLDMAMKLAERYGVSLDDLKSGVEPTIKRYDFDGNAGGLTKHLHEVDSLLAVSIANFCAVKTWRSTGTSHMTFFGVDSDVELAVYLRGVLRETMEFEFSIYLEFEHEGSFVGARGSFMAKFAERIIKRMSFLQRRKENTTGTELIVLKNQLVTEAYTKLGMRLGRGKAGKSVKYNAQAGAAGAMAGDRADIGRATARQGNAGLLT